MTEVLKHYSLDDIKPMTDEEIIEAFGSMDEFLDRAFRHQQCGFGAHVCSKCGSELSHRSQLETMLCRLCQEDGNAAVTRIIEGA